MQIQSDISLKSFNTFGIDVKAKHFADVFSIQDLIDLKKSSVFSEKNVFILGGGSNLLLTKDYNGLIIKISNKGIAHKSADNKILVSAAAGEVWNDLVQYCVKNNLQGIENLSLIPGSVGASPIQNIGAYGVELKDVFHSLKAFEIATGEERSFNKLECKFSYRESIFKQEFKNKYIITEVTLELEDRGNLNLTYGSIMEELKNRSIEHPSIKDVSEVVSSIRVSKLPDPSTIGNSGSFFKNPIVSKTIADFLKNKFPEMVQYPVDTNTTKIAAGWLIEDCGWKGKSIGNVATWKNQALVIVNLGGASGKEVFEFSQNIIDSVQEKFGIELEREVNIL